MKLAFFSAAVTLLFIVSSSSAVTISGTASLDNAADHSGIEVKFVAVSPSAVTVSVFTNAAGFFSSPVTIGVYDVQYIRAGYQSQMLVGKLFSVDEVIANVTLSSTPVVNVSGGNVSGTWTEGTVYNVTGDITVPNGSVLTIERGVEVRFSGFYRLTVNGNLQVKGEPGSQVLFTSSKPNKARGDWAGITVRTTGLDTTRFDYAKVEYGGSNMESSGLIWSQGNTVIRNCVIRASAYGGVYNQSGGYLKISDTEIFDCYYYGLISGTSAAGGTADNCKIHDIDLIGLETSTFSRIRRCWVYNTGYNGIHSFNNTTIEESVLFNNPYGIFVVGGKPLIKNNTIFSNAKGIGFYDAAFWHPSAVITSNIISGNTGHAIFSTGVYGPEKVEYNLFHANGALYNLSSLPALGSILATNANGTPSDVYYNIFQDPLFVSTNPANADFVHLQNGSAAVHAGDPQYEFCDGSVVNCGSVFPQCAQTINFPMMADRTYGESSFQLNASASSGLTIVYTSSNTDVVSLSGGMATIVGAGTATITATQAGNYYFDSAVESQPVIVQKANQAINFGAQENRVFGGAPFTLTASASSGLPLSFTSSDPLIVTISGNTVSIVGVGTVMITASQSGNSNYLAANSSQSLIIQQAIQSITFPSIVDKTLGDSPFALLASSTSGLTVQYSSTSNKVSIANEVITLIQPGRVEVQASQPGNLNIMAASTITNSFCIKPQAPSITELINSGAEVTLTSSASSGNQWYLNGDAISGAVDSELVAMESGAYTVTSTVDDCLSAHSPEFIPVITGDLGSILANDAILLYPNPTVDRIVIDLAGFDPSQPIAIFMLDFASRIRETLHTRQTSLSFDVSDYPDGVYLIKVTQGAKSMTKKFVKFSGR